MALRSMTAYGHGEHVAGDLSYVCEIRTLNSRFLEVNVRMPRYLVALEPEIHRLMKKRLGRGKTDIFIEIGRSDGGRELPELDPNAVSHYAQLIQQVQQHLGDNDQTDALDKGVPRAADYFRFDGVLVGNERRQQRGQDSVDRHREGLMAALEGAIKQTISAREQEGDSLASALKDLAADLEKHRAEVAAKRTSILGDLRANLKKRFDNAVQSIGGGAAELSEERIMAEVAMLSDKADVEEEMVRLETHIQEFLRHLTFDDPVGRKLDFLCQEMHREVNTTANKLVQTDVSQHTLQMKQTVEQLRQQVQNIE